jgi:hypothetical protein
VSGEEELVQVDRYLDALLASRYELREAAEPDVDEDLRAAAVAVQRALPRFHPSFAFEERLAHRLRSTTAGSPGSLIAFLPRQAAATADGAAVPVERRGRGVLLGSAIASGVSIAGVSLAGAALLARRRGRSTAAALRG